MNVSVCIETPSVELYKVKVKGGNIIFFYLIWYDGCNADSENNNTERGKNPPNR